MPSPRITVHLDEPGATITPEIYGHFAEHLGACVDEGIWVGEDSKIPNVAGLRSDVIEAVRRVRPGVIRWPGGCFADDYHWEDGVGPRAKRPRTVNMWWGHSLEDNQFGTHEFLRFCGLVGAKPYLAGNVGSGSPAQMKQWVEYCNFAGDSTLARRRAENGSPHPLGVYYWGVGNENWGCGGSLSPEDYAALYKRFSTYLATFTRAPLHMPLYLIACGPQGNDPSWTRRFFEKTGGAPRGDWQLHGFAAHYYCGTAGTATEYDANQWHELLDRARGVEELILQQRATLDSFDPQRKIGLIIDEWGTWHPPSAGRNPNHLWQQNTLRDALAAAITLDAFNRHADKVVMANIAQLANVLQALILTDGDRMLLTPTYHVFEMFQSHQNGRSLPTRFEGGGQARYAVGEQRRQHARLSGSASLLGRTLTLSVVNADPQLPIEAEIDLRGGGRLTTAAVSTLADEDIHAHNTVEAPARLTPTRERVDFAAGPSRHVFPPASVTVISASVA